MQENQELVRPAAYSHAFDIGLASAYGIEESLIISHFQYWIRKNKTSKQNFIDGRTWTYQTYKEISEHFPYLSSQTVRRCINNLVSFGVIIKSNYNKLSNDNTVWFAFQDESVYMPELVKAKPKPPEIPPEQPDLPPLKDPAPPPLSKSTDPCLNRQTSVEIGTAIPHTLPHTLPHVKTTNQGDGSVGGLPKEINIYQCLQKVDIQEKDKIRLASQFDEQTVSKSVAHCSKPGFKIQTSLDASIFYFCKNPAYITKTKEDIKAEKIKLEEQKSENEMKSRYLCRDLMKSLWTKALELGVYMHEGHNYMEISNDRIQEKVYYSNEKFMALVSHVLKKVGLDLPPTLKGFA